MSAVVFFFAAIGAIAGAVGVVAMANPFYNVLSLVFHLLSLAALFLLLRAQFVAAAQVVVYAGAVMVLYVFVVAYIGGQDEPLGGASGRGAKTAAFLFAGALLVELCIAVLGSGLDALSTRGAGFDAADPNGFGTPGYIGRLLLTKFLFPFEAASFLLLIAAVGAVVLAGRRRGLEELDPEELPELAGTSPIPTGSGGPSVPGEDIPTRIPAGTAEGPKDPVAQ
jgi:NADH-quinone oxidoreductase subunit J